MYKNKYGARKVVYGDQVFDSRKEFRRYEELRMLEKAGKIRDLRRQVKYILIPAQREWTNEVYKAGKKKGCFKPGKLLERECAYIADFVYFDCDAMKLVVEDTKGVRTKEYIIKRKLMLHVHGVRISEV